MSKPAAASEKDSFTIELRASNEDELPIYLVGNFNQWRTADERYRMQKVGAGHYQLVIKLGELPEQLEYKYARGSWDHVELQADGQDRPNRVVVKHQLVIQDEVVRWKQDAFSYPKQYLPQIAVIDQDLNLPEAIRTRRIAALLPYNYYETDRRYPVLYLQDGQNLFDDYAPYGNWGVDKRLAQLQTEGHGDVIIVAIDHAQDKRIVEFTPSDTSTRFGAGEGRKYARFLAEKLKPYVDQQFRTLSDYHHTGIGGSSMGGLISIYAGMLYPKVFGRLMVFSPSLWVTPNIRFQLLNFKEPYTGRVYLYGGKKESATMIPNLRRLQIAIDEKAGAEKPAFRLSTDPEGEHNEARWGVEFPHAIRWLFF
ncbi:MAG: alpha/beta hydrolase-fold protein [Bacteroidota bacterium]